MTIEFMFNNIKNIELIYLIEEKYDEVFCDNIKVENYLGTAYCRSVMDKLQMHFPEIKNRKIPVALTTFLKANPQIKTIYLHLDKASRLCTAALKELLQKDYRIVDESPPVGKDFNDFLMSYLGIARQKPSRERGDVR